MKKLVLIPVLLTACAVLLITTSSSPASRYEPEWIPFFMERADLERSVSYKDTPREMENPGKIYISGNYIFVNEKYTGVHIIDNSNAAAPEQKAFIVVPGCLDMAVKGNIIYLDNAVDLVAFDLDAKKETGRIDNYFPERLIAPDGTYTNNRPAGLILAGWRKNPNYKSK